MKYLPIALSALIISLLVLIPFVLIPALTPTPHFTIAKRGITKECWGRGMATRCHVSLICRGHICHSPAYWEAHP